MTDLTIPARLVAEAGCLPPVWRSVTGAWRFAAKWDLYPKNIRNQGIDLSEPQTAFGLALKLDGWERAGGRRTQWAADLALALHVTHDCAVLTTFLGGMVARLTHIARFRCTDMGELSSRIVWEMKDGDGDHYWTNNENDVVGCEDTTTHLATLVGITDPTEALRAIYEEENND